MKLLRKILFPLVPVYYSVTWLRNYLYDKGLKSSKHYDVPVICVGNLSTGGSGKSPMIEYLIATLQEHYTIAVLSRGYKRLTTGFVLANENSTPQDIGDEPYQIFKKFEGITVAVDGNRQEGIEGLLEHNPSIDIILLDDAFQHRKVSAKLNILLTPYYDMYYNDMVLPTGNLREPRAGAKRADLIIVTKCPPNITETEKQSIIANIAPKPHQSVFYSFINYDERAIGFNETINLKVLSDFTLVTGIANPVPLVQYLKGLGLTFEHLVYGDHHHFTMKDIQLLSTKGKLLTTEKDYVRLKDFEVLEARLYYLPISVSIDQSENFKTKVLEYCK
ncbi:MAG: tetraacyldisaccharide 4'-kinase [Winogradskyella sp.]|nr:tetraacyldisaccharide 4'-kinase [Winogradskyella sp.]